MKHIRANGENFLHPANIKRYLSEILYMILTPLWFAAYLLVLPILIAYYLAALIIFFVEERTKNIKSG